MIGVRSLYGASIHLIERLVDLRRDKKQVCYWELTLEHLFYMLLRAVPGILQPSSLSERINMSTKATATFAVKSWEEETYSELEGDSKFTRVSAAYTYEGEIEGESTLEYLMFYRTDGTGVFVGLERVVGRVGGRAGAFVLQHSGTFHPTGVDVSWFIVPNSGTDELQGLHGKSSYSLAGHGPYPFILEYGFA
jgi:hypothetical protein